MLFQGEYSDEVSFIAANNPEGTSWGLPAPGVPWFTNVDAGSYDGPVDIAGHPALALYDYYNPQPGTGYSEVSYVVFY